MIDPNSVGTVADCLEIIGAGASVVQWLRSLKQSKTDATINEYLEWLRRQNHLDLLRQLEGNQAALDGLSQTIEQIKDGVFGAILAHEASTAERHDQIMAVATSFADMSPKLTVKTWRELQTDIVYGRQLVFARRFRSD